MAPDRKPRKVIAIWMVARNRLGSSTRRRAVRAPPVAVLGQLAEPVPLDRDEGHLAGGEEAADEDEDNDNQRGRWTGLPKVLLPSIGRCYFRLPTGSDPPRMGRAPPRRRGCRARPAVASVACSIGRAGTPTTFLPGATSRVTTDPAPVTAPSPMVTGATIIVSTPMLARSPMTVRCLAVPSKLAVTDAGPDVHVLADLRVTDVADVMLLRSRPKPAVLDLGEVTDAASGADLRPRAQVREWPDLHVLCHDGLLEHAGPYAGARSDPAVADLRVRPDHGVLRDDGCPLQDRPRLDTSVLADLDGCVDPGRGRIDDRHPVPHVRLDDATPHPLLCRGQCRPIVDAHRVGGVVGLDDAHGPAVGDRHGHQVGEVFLAGRGGRHTSKRRTQPGRVERVRAPR